MLALLLVALILPATVVDAVRAVRGDAIAVDPVLTEIAQRRAVEIATDYSHTGAGTPYAEWGEILGWNAYPEELSVEALIAGFLDSPEHRPVLLGDWSLIGVGVHQVEGRTYYAVLFANPDPPPVPSCHFPAYPVWRYGVRDGVVRWRVARLITDRACAAPRWIRWPGHGWRYLSRLSTGGYVSTRYRW